MVEQGRLLTIFRNRFDKKLNRVNGRSSITAFGARNERFTSLTKGEAFPCFLQSADFPFKMRFSPGTRLNQYELRSVVGAGRGGEVYLACDTQLRRTVALKVMAASSANDAEHSQVDLLEEARAASALNHPNILTTYEIGTAGSIVFVATEFVDGETLRARLSSQPLELYDALNISLQIGSALSATHAEGLIHGDLKPENIVLRADGLVKILDFGLARRPMLPGQETRSTSVTQAHMSGTSGYLAPEQLQGGQPDARTDLWAFGMVIFEMLTGKRPFARGRVEDELRAIRDAEPPLLSSFHAGVPLALERIVRRALAKNSKERYQSAAEILSDLRALAEQLSINSSRRTTINIRSEQPANEAPLPASGISTQNGFRDSLAGWSFYSPSNRRRFLWIGMTLIAMALIMVSVAGTRPGFLYGATTLLLLGLSCLLLRYAPIAARTAILSAPAASVAFRGLVPFQEADRDSFYGRQIETAMLFAMVTREEFRFGAFFGESGCGKTSLLLAGLIPKLWDEGYVPLYCRSFTDPLAAVLDECRKRSRLQQQENETTIAYLRRVVRQFEAPLIIICDQFEEFFVNFRNASEREPFITFVTDCHHERDLPVRFLFSLRSDFLYLINAAFTDRVSEPLLSTKLYHLRNFDEDVAEEILERSARSAALPFEPRLGRQIAADIAVDRKVAPSELQIVGSQLQARRIFTFDAYRRSGAKEALVHDFLEDLIQASGEADNARLLLRSLISEENTHLTLSIAEICKRTQRNGEIVSRLLELFTNARLVRELQEQEPWRYELMHEYLIDKINLVTGQVLNATQRANRQFRQYLASYSLERRTLIPLTRLWSIRRYSDIPRGQRERELLRTSARLGIARAGALVLLLGLITTAVAAYFSINEQWQSVRLSDGHSASARHIVFSPDGQRLVSCGEDGKVIVWDFLARQRIATLMGHQGWVNWVDYSSDGKSFATAGQDQTVIVWDATTLQRAAVLREHRSGVNMIAFSPDGKWLVSASADNDQRLIIWEVNGWRKAQEIAYAMKWGQILFSPDSRHLIRPSGASWDVATGQRLSDDITELGGYGALNAQGSQALSIDGAGNVALLDLSQHKIVFRTRGHQFHGRVAIFSPDGRFWATGSEDIVLWDAATRTKLLRLPYVSEVWGLALSRDGRWLVSSYTDGEILLWDMKEREVAASFNEHSGSVRAVAFSVDGRRLASASEDKSVVVWNVAQGRKEVMLAGHNTRVTSVVFPPNGDWLVSGDQDGHVIRWDMQRRQPLWDFSSPQAVPAYSVSVSPDGRWIAQTNGVNDSTDGHLLLDFYARDAVKHSGQFYGIRFSPDGQRLIGVTDSGEVLMWDTQTWQLVKRLELKGASLICIAFAADGLHFVTGEDEGAVRLWETEGLRQLAVIGWHTARVKAVDFSPDGREVVSAGDDQSISLWNVAGGRAIAHLGTHTAPVLAVDYSPDGKHIASGGQDKSVRIYTRQKTLWGYNLR
jgi:WD40 repeat protein/serine/threonine protein kinase